LLFSVAEFAFASPLSHLLAKLARPAVIRFTANDISRDLINKNHFTELIRVC
jgi:hypothetical protein